MALELRFCHSELQGKEEEEEKEGGKLLMAHMTDAWT